MTLRAALALAVLAVAGPLAVAQDQKPKTPTDHFKEARDLIASGGYELAAEALERFLASNPTDDQVLDVEAKFGPTAFLRLRNVLKWSDNKAENEKAKNTVDAVIARQQLASTRKFKDPARIADLVRRLSSFREERLYAEGQLKLAGVAALPEMLKAFRATNKPELQAIILALVSKMPIETVPAMVAALDGLTEAEKVLMIDALAAYDTKDGNVLTLLNAPETNILPFLWYHASDPSEVKSSLRDKARATLERLYGPAVHQTKAEAALTGLAEPIAAGKATYRHQDPMDKPAGLVRVWTYDPAGAGLKSQDVPRPVADEYFALKSLRWALARNPNYAPAQRLFTSFATERAVERAKFGDLSKSEPAVYQILAAAPAELLIDLLETGLSEKRTALVLGMLQALGDRAHKDAATAPAAKPRDDHPSPLVRALSYDDPRVQFAAAVALVRQPGPPTHGKTARVVEILRQALAADADGSGAGTAGRALIADTNAVRGEGLAQMFRAAGYAAERFASGRQLVARLSRASDYDLIVVDRHVVDPLLNDTLVQVTADTNAARRPVFVIASTDKPRSLPVEILLLRLSNIVAATDDGVIQAGTGYEGSKPLQIVIPPPYAFNPDKPDKDRDEAKRNNILVRDRGMIGPSDLDRAESMKSGQPQPPANSLFNLRLGRLKRLVEAADLPIGTDLNDRLNLRLPQLVLAGLVADFEATPETAPRTVDRLEQATRNLLARRELAPAAADIPDLGNLLRLLEQLESKLTPDQRARLRRIQDRTSPARLGLPTDYNRDTDLEAKVAAQVKRMKSVRVLPEPFAPEYLRSDIETAIQNPADKPRDPAERLDSAKVAAEMLRRMAVGELPGYDIRPAEAELRAALKNDATAESALEAVAKLGTEASQSKLLELALAKRPLPIRLKAADAAIRHVQAFGRMTEGAIPTQLAQAATVEPDLALRGKLGVLTQLLSGKAGDYGGALQKFPIRLSFPQAPGTIPPKEPMEKKDGEPKL